MVSIRFLCEQRKKHNLDDFTKTDSVVSIRFLCEQRKKHLVNKLFAYSVTVSIRFLCEQRKKHTDTGVGLDAYGFQSASFANKGRNEVLLGDEEFHGVSIRFLCEQRKKQGPSFALDQVRIVSIRFLCEQRKKRYTSESIGLLTKVSIRFLCEQRKKLERLKVVMHETGLFQSASFANKGRNINQKDHKK
ncbi:hypothetical protein LEP1GSC008_3499 [Leptospira kirschneri serovar Bulgarica str. Nikolaevo]|uniref:Uncharacterized protein n=1 Tax=Leptospira kirschneri serovar Bulgarica str. Nikolaevo TaxID=1240687 RepID=M6F6H7_9LEPT|nr:hypothetical protein LEP1GSC008_3499 [Leptospira kirschneri serovar Bulgarica str. Nikolaevo]